MPPLHDNTSLGLYIEAHRAPGPWKCNPDGDSPWARSGFTFDNDNDAVLFKLRWG
jgi:hypothetical protein